MILLKLITKDLNILKVIVSVVLNALVLEFAPCRTQQHCLE